MVQTRKIQFGQVQFMVDLESACQRYVQATNAAQEATRLVAVEQPLTGGTWTTASVSTQEVWGQKPQVWQGGSS